MDEQFSKDQYAWDAEFSRRSYPHREDWSRVVKSKMAAATRLCAKVVRMDLSRCSYSFLRIYRHMKTVRNISSVNTDFTNTGKVMVENVLVFEIRKFR